MNETAQQAIYLSFWYSGADWQISVQSFVKERLVECSIPLSDSIKRNKLPPMSCPSNNPAMKSCVQIASLKSDYNLFSRLYIACQTRDGNFKDLFMFENQPCPPSIFHRGKIRICAKADLLQCLEDLAMPTKESLSRVPWLSMELLLWICSNQSPLEHLASMQLKCSYHISRGNCNMLKRDETSSGMSTRKIQRRQPHERGVEKEREEKWNPTPSPWKLAAIGWAV